MIAQKTGRLQKLDADAGRAHNGFNLACDRAMPTSHPTDLERVTAAFSKRQSSPADLGVVLDELLRLDRLDPLFSQLYRQWPSSDFETLRQLAIPRACFSIEMGPDQPKGGLLLGLPLIARAGDLPALAPDFWARLTAYAQVVLQAPHLRLAPLAEPLQPSTMAYFRIGAWHQMLREAVRGEPLEHRDLLVLMEHSKTRATPPPPQGQVVALTQRIVPVVCHYDPTQTSGLPLRQLMHVAQERRKVWEDVCGQLPEHAHLLPPILMVDAMALCLEQYFDLIVQMALKHRGLAPHAPIELVTTESDAEMVTFIFQSRAGVLDPVPVPHAWLNLVGAAGVERLLNRLLTPAPSNVTDAVPDEEPSAPLPKPRRLH